MGQGATKSLACRITHDDRNETVINAQTTVDVIMIEAILLGKVTAIEYILISIVILLIHFNNRLNYKLVIQFTIQIPVLCTEIVYLCFSFQS